MNLVVPYDACARTGGPAEGASILATMLEGAPFRRLPREGGSMLHSLVEAEVRQAARSGECPLVLGGDHSLTYPAVRGLVSLLGALTVVHFDAHHDAWANAALNHYTVFHHIDRLGVKIVGLGYRYATEPQPPAPRRPIMGPVYVSVDFDYFDPGLIAGVGHAVPCAPELRCDLDSFRSSLDWITGPVVGIDLVEWTGAPAGSPERENVAAVLNGLLALRARAGRRASQQRAPERK